MKERIDNLIDKLDDTIKSARAEMIARELKRKPLDKQREAIALIDRSVDR